LERLNDLAYWFFFNCSPYEEGHGFEPLKGATFTEGTFTVSLTQMGIDTSNVQHPAAQAAARLPFYYGWVMLILAAVAMTATLPGRTYGLGLIAKQLTADSLLNVNELQFTRLNFWGVIIGSVLCVPVGRLIDRFGVRAVSTCVALGLGGSVIWMSEASSAVVLLLALILVRGLGQGSLSVVSMAMVGKWFTRRLPVAMGVFAVLLTIGMIASILVVTPAAEEYGWRRAWAGVGWCLILVVAPLSLLLARSTPEAIGAPADRAAATAALPTAPDIEFYAALRSPGFWAFTLAASLFNLAFSAITFLNENLLSARGFDSDTFKLVMPTLAAIGLPVNLLSGWAAPRLGMGRLLALGMSLLAGSLFAFPHLQSPAHAVAFGALLGSAGGIITVVWFSVYGHAFGRKRLGAIQAAAQTVSVVASAVGPYSLALCNEQSGSYLTFFYFAAPLALLLGGAVLVVKMPQAEAQVETCPN
jgi:MFS family permease